MTAAFKKTLRVGTAQIGNRRASVYIFVKFNGSELSITGVEGPLASGNALGSCGQIDMHLKPAMIAPAAAWSMTDIEKLWTIWDRWHLNHMQSGDAAQMAWLHANPDVPMDFKARKAALAAAGLGDHYGSKWWIEAVPSDVLDWLKALPDSDKPVPGLWRR